MACVDHPLSGVNSEKRSRECAPLDTRGDRTKNEAESSRGPDLVSIYCTISSIYLFILGGGRATENPPAHWFVGTKYHMSKADVLIQK